MLTWPTLLVQIALLLLLVITVNGYPSRLDRAFVGGPVRECPSGMKHDENGVCRPISSNSATTQATYIIIRPEANTVPVIITRPPTTATSSRRTRRPTTYNRHVKNYYHSQQ